MIRNVRQLLLPAIAAATLLSGCVTYGYRNGHGDYYYGQPTTEYAYPYGYYGDYGYPGYYGSPYWGGSFGYYRYYGPRRPPHHDGDGHGHGGGSGNGGNGGHPPPQNPPDRPRPPWRDLGNLPPKLEQQQEQQQRDRPRMPGPLQRAPQVQMPPRNVERVQRVERPAPARPSGNPKRDIRRNPVP